MEVETGLLARSADLAASLRASRSSWVPLERVVPSEWLSGFMWVGATRTDDADPIQIYKHGITRSLLLLDHCGRAYDATATRAVSVWEAVEHVYAEIEATGHTRDTPYTDDLIAERSLALRAEGWSVVHSAPLRYTD